MVIKFKKGDVKLTKVLSTSGKFGFFAGVGKVTGAAFAPIHAKLLKAGHTEKEKIQLLSEATVLSDCDHPNIIRIYGVIIDSAITLVHEPFPESNGSLYMFLQDDIEKSLLRKFAIDIAEALIYLSSRKMVHWDVAARNVLVTDDVRCKLCNFARRKDIDDPAPSGWYTAPDGNVLMRWSPPEVVDVEKEDRIMSSKEDVWCFGFFMYELYTKATLPYREESWSSDEMIVSTMNVLQQGSLLPQPESCSNEVFDLIADCWEPTPSKRPNFKAIRRQLLSPEAFNELEFALQEEGPVAIKSETEVIYDKLYQKSRPTSPPQESKEEFDKYKNVEYEDEVEQKAVLEDNQKLREEMEKLRSDLLETLADISDGSGRSQDAIQEEFAKAFHLSAQLLSSPQHVPEVYGEEEYGDDTTDPSQFNLDMYQQELSAQQPQRQQQLRHHGQKYNNSYQQYQPQMPTYSVPMKKYSQNNDYDLSDSSAMGNSFFRNLMQSQVVEDDVPVHNQTPSVVRKKETQQNWKPATFSINRNKKSTPSQGEAQEEPIFKSIQLKHSAPKEKRIQRRDSFEIPTLKAISKPAPPQPSKPVAVVDDDNMPCTFLGNCRCKDCR
eukprot:m.77771 g.77771  ORF g.77771 m.77771 type:complete len:607 (+) comp8554_c0_seq4:220-2040(+)